MNKHNYVLEMSQESNYVKIKGCNLSLENVVQDFNHEKNDLLKNELWCLRYALLTLSKIFDDVWSLIVLVHITFITSQKIIMYFLHYQFQFLWKMIELVKLKLLDLLRFVCLMKFNVHTFKLGLNLIWDKPDIIWNIRPKGSWV